MHRSSLTLLGLVALTVVGCGPRPAVLGSNNGEGGIGGTGVAPDVDGVGGTGVFGTVTGLGSIDVSGLRIELPQGQRGGGWQVGDTVAAVVERQGQGLVARRAEAIHALTGPVTEVDVSRRLLAVMGTPVALDSEAALAGIAPGTWLQVSGLWRSGVVVASRIARVPAGAPASVAGLLTARGTDRTVGGTRVDLACCADAEAGFAILTGRYRDGVLAVAEARLGAPALFRPGVDRLVVEAFLARNPNDPGYHLSGFGIPMDPASPIRATVGERSIFVGRFDGDFLIERSYRLPAGLAARRAALEALGTGELLR